MFFFPWPELQQLFRFENTTARLQCLRHYRLSTLSLDVEIEVVVLASVLLQHNRGFPEEKSVITKVVFSLEGSRET